MESQIPSSTTLQPATVSWVLEILARQLVLVLRPIIAVLEVVGEISPFHSLIAALTLAQNT